MKGLSGYGAGWPHDKFLARLLRLVCSHLSLLSIKSDSCVQSGEFGLDSAGLKLLSTAGVSMRLSAGLYFIANLGQTGFRGRPLHDRFSHTWLFACSTA